MSSSPPPSSPTPSTAPAHSPTSPQPSEVLIYGHSNLFFWWPVWAMGYIMGFVTMVGSDGRMAIIPAGSIYVKNVGEFRDAGGKPMQDTAGKPLEAGHNTIVLPKDKHGNPVELFDRKKEQVADRADLSELEKVHPSKGLGVWFTFTVLLVVVITNVPLRGLKSAVAIGAIIILVLFFALMGWWDRILNAFSFLSIHMNMGFYFFFSTVLLIIWLFVFFVYDRAAFWRVTPGQIRREYHPLLGGSQIAYNTDSIRFEKMRDDMRHIILGLNSGDLVMHPLQAVAEREEELTIRNVIGVTRKIQEIDNLIASRPT